MQTLYTSLLTIEELSTASARLLPLISPLIAGNPLLEEIAAEAQKHQTAIILSLSRQDTSEYTARLEASDAARDAAFVALRDFAAIWSKTPTATPEQMAAAARIVKIIAAHGNTLHRLGYNRQSGKMTALLTDLSTPEATADLTAVNLLPLFQLVRTSQNTFEEIVAEKNVTEGSDPLPTLAQHRPHLERQLNLMLATIDEAQTIGSAAVAASAIGQIDEVIVQIATPALARRTKSESTPPPAPTPPQP
jgi:N-acyl-L-homoserine lactone synthetase